MECFKWLGFSTVLSSNPSTNLLHFSRILRGRKERVIAVSIWECIIWIIWKARNANIFRSERAVMDKLLTEIKIRSWSWIQAKEIGLESSLMKQIPYFIVIGMSYA
ncbi:hypothetical protein ACS0TY_014580 [Phlomoides rotata]